MFPTKGMYEYLTEMNRLFPKTTENDLFQLPSTPSNSGFLSPTSQTANRSSSSADSISPESFPELSHWQRQHDTPTIIRRQRPIVGRKIFDKPLEPTRDEIEIPSTGWHDDQLSSRTPPSNVFLEQNNYTQNVFYELFPSENRGYEFKTPVKSNVSSYSLSPTPTSPSFSPNHINISPRAPKFPAQRTPFPVTNRIVPNLTPQPVTGDRLCTFCRKNGETPLVYMTHAVKERVGSKNIVTCPILRCLICSTCGATGDDAHTITYCPVLRSTNNGQPLQSTTITLKNTRIKSNGRRRF